jgi:hypothetical protein
LAASLTKFSKHTRQKGVFENIIPTEKHTAIAISREREETNNTRKSSLHDSKRSRLHSRVGGAANHSLWRSIRAALRVVSQLALAKHDGDGARNNNDDATSDDASNDSWCERRVAAAGRR